MADTSNKRYKTVSLKVKCRERAKIPTTLVPFAPDKISFSDEKDAADLLCACFHIMWADMPGPRTYELKLADLFSLSGDYLGARLECAYPKRNIIAC